MRKLISFTLYGDDPKYVWGMYRNIDLKHEFYPDWEIIIYHDNSLKPEVIDRLSKDAILRNVDGCGVSAAAWRFFVHDEPDIERFIVRDSDSRLSEREAAAVREWEESGKILHVMRDHPHHGYSMNGGMWGMIPDKNANMRDLCRQYEGGKITGNDREGWWMKDMEFLRNVVYKAFGTERHCMAHAGMDFMHKVGWNNEPWAKDFPIPRNENKNFVGEIFVFDDNLNEQREYQYKEL